MMNEEKARNVQRLLTANPKMSMDTACLLIGISVAEYQSEKSKNILSGGFFDFFTETINQMKK